MTSFIKKLHLSKYNLILILILLLASFLRLYRISDYMTFLGDEGRDLIEVKKILSGNLVFLGPRSSAADFYYGPVYFYLITPFLLLSNYDPVGPAIFIAILGIVTVYLVYYVGREFFGIYAGLFSSALYAVSPLVIAYSRSSWNPNPMPFVALLSLFLAYKAIKSKSNKLFLISGILLGIAIQLQYLALFLGCILFSFTILGTFTENNKNRLKLVIKSVGLEFSGFLIGWSPFLAFELKNGFPNLKTIITYILSGNSEKTYSSSSEYIEKTQSVFFKIFARLMTRFPTSESININKDISLWLWQILTIVLGMLSVIMIFKIKDKLVKLFFFIWFFGSIILFGFYKGQIHDYYLGVLFPLPFLLVGNLLSFTFRYKNIKIQRYKQFGLTILKIFFVGIFLFLFIFNLESNPFKFTPNRQKEQIKTIAEFVLSKTDNKPYNFALLSSGNSDHGYRYYLEILGHPPTVIQIDKVDPERKSVAKQLLVVCEDRDCQPLGSGLWEIAGFGRAEIVGEWQVSVVKVYKLKHYLQ